MLTTTDNPFNPFTDFEEWYAYDTQRGYHTLAYLARIVRTSNELSDADQSLAIEQGIDEIVRENILGIYTKVAAEDTDNDSSPQESDSKPDDV